MEDFAWLGPTIDARGLFTGEREQLLELLEGLSPQQWHAAAVPGWDIRDAAAHLLGHDYGRLAGLRDGDRSGPAPRPGEAFEAFIHRANREWVEAARRISPPMLVETLELTGARIAELWRSCDLDARGRPVSWAGADPAPLWLDCARDLTEYWTHRQQIRAALGLAAEDRPDSPPVLAVVLDTFMRALPHTLRAAPAAPGTRVRVDIGGPAGGAWTVSATDSGTWAMAPGGGRAAGPVAARVEFDAATAWRLCVRAIDPEAARSRARVAGDRRLAEAVCRMVAIIY